MLQSYNHLFLKCNVFCVAAAVLSTYELSFCLHTIHSFSQHDTKIWVYFLFWQLPGMVLQWVMTVKQENTTQTVYRMQQVYKQIHSYSITSQLRFDWSPFTVWQRYASTCWCRFCIICVMQQEPLTMVRMFYFIDNMLHIVSNCTFKFRCQHWNSSFSCYAKLHFLLSVLMFIWWKYEASSNLDTLNGNLPKLEPF